MADAPAPGGGVEDDADQDRCEDVSITSDRQSPPGVVIG
jgi:hypothetical protein